MFGDGTVGHDGRAHARTKCGDAGAQRRQHIAADDDVVGAIAERNVDGDWIGVSQWRGHGVALNPSVVWSIVSWLATRVPHRRTPRAARHSSTIRSCGTSR